MAKEKVHRKLEEKESTIQSEVPKVMNITSDDLSTNVNVPDNSRSIK